MKTNVKREDIFMLMIGMKHLRGIVMVLVYGSHQVENGCIKGLATV
jgi:hypothetical protein